MNLPGVRFTLAQMMVVVAGCATFFAVCRILDLTVNLLCYLVPGQLIGALIHRWRGGGGILGGVSGGILWYYGFMLYYAGTTHYGLSLANLFGATACGVVSGFVVGLFVWGTFELADKFAPN
jgi:hypothetical protein